MENSILSVVCDEVLANSSVNARNLCRHLTTHEPLANKLLQFFERKLLEADKQSNLMKTAVVTMIKAPLASLQVSYFIAKNKMPHTIRDIIASSSIKMYKFMQVKDMV
jgi:hypothetical protein